MTAGYRAIDHTADLAIAVWADSEVALLVMAARALTELLMDGAPARGPAAERSVALTTLDREDRVVRWLSEVLYLASSERFIFVDAEITLGGDGLTATLSGVDAEPAQEIKAVTYHDLSVTHTAGQWRATVVFDV